MGKKERQEKLEMKERLIHAFDHARDVKEKHNMLLQKHQDDKERWTDVVRDMKERHKQTLQRLHGDGAVQEVDRQEQLSQFGEQVMQDLSALQQHLREVRQETVDEVLFEDEDAEVD